MPIQKLTTNVQPRFKSIGTLRKGELVEKPSKRNPGQTVKYPVDLDHFRFTSDDPAVMKAFQAVYGLAPKMIRAYLPPRPTIDDVFPCWQEEWRAGGLVHRCDGETMALWLTPDKRYSTEPRPCPYHADPKLRTKQAPGCKAVGRMGLILPELVTAGYVGYVTLLTGSLNDISNLLAALYAAREHRPGVQGAGVDGIEWTIWRQEVEIPCPTDDGGRARRKKWMLNMVPSVQWVQARMQLAQAAALGQLAAVAGPGPDDAETDADGLALEAGEGIDDMTAPGFANVDAEDGDFEEMEEEPAGEWVDAPAKAAPVVAVTPGNGNGHGDPAPAEQWEHLCDKNFAVPNWFDPAPTNLSAARAVKLDFGKHGGRTLGEIADDNIGYIAWLTDKYDAGPAPTDYQKRVKRAAIYLRSYRRYEEWQAEQKYAMPEGIEK